jgi:hypothetical protein
MDRVADVAEQFDIGLPADPRLWRCVLDDPESYPEENGEMTSDAIFEQIIYCSDLCVDRLNEVTEGGYWEWTDGEFFLVQTEVEGFIYVRVDDGETYDDAWRLLVEYGPTAAVTDYEDLDKGERAYPFRITIHYEPEGE